MITSRYNAEWMLPTDRPDSFGQFSARLRRTRWKGVGQHRAQDVVARRSIPCVGNPLLRVFGDAARAYRREASHDFVNERSFVNLPERQYGAAPSWVRTWKTGRTCTKRGRQKKWQEDSPLLRCQRCWRLSLYQAAMMGGLCGSPLTWSPGRRLARSCAHDHRTGCGRVFGPDRSRLAPGKGG